MGIQMIESMKHLTSLISQAKSESSHLSSNKSQLSQIESLSLQIHDKFLTATTEEERIKKNILSLQLKLEENTRISDYYKDALIRLLIPQDFSLTLVYKSQNNIPYIKGRVYWDNKQREVQIGSVVNVINQIRRLCKDELLPPIKDLEKNNIEWEDIKSNPQIESAVKYVGKIKFKLYLLKYFQFPKENTNSAQLLQADFNSPKKTDSTDNEGNSIHSLDAKDWYSIWRKDNL